jgi:hypothetical protein
MRKTNPGACILAVVAAGLIVLAGKHAGAAGCPEKQQLPLKEEPVAIKKKNALREDFLPSGLFIYF